MISQQSAQKIKSQDRVQVKVWGRQVVSSLQLHINTEREAVSSFDYVITQHIIAIEEKLFEAVRMIKDSCRGLHDCKSAVDALTRKYKNYKQAYSEDQWRLTDYIQAYSALHAQQKKTVNDLNDMTDKCLSLHQELEKTQKVRHTLELKIQKHKRNVSHKAISDRNKDHETNQLDWNVVLQSIMNNKQIEVKNEQLTAQNKQLTAESKQLTAENKQLTAENKQLMIKKLKLENTLINAASYISTAEKKINELENMHQTAQHQELMLMNSTEFLKSKQSDLKKSGFVSTVWKCRQVVKWTEVEEE